MRDDPIYAAAYGAAYVRIEGAHAHLPGVEIDGWAHEIAMRAVAFSHHRTTGSAGCGGTRWWLKDIGADDGE